MEVKTLTFPITDITLYTRLLELTPTPFLACLEGKDPHQIDSASLIGAFAYQNDKPCALLIGSYYVGLSKFQIHFFTFNQEALPFAEELFALSLSLAKQKKIQFATFLLSEDDSSIKDISELLKKMNWQGPKAFSREYHFFIKDFNPGWIYKNFILPINGKIVLFKDLSKKHLLEIEEEINKENIPYALSPFGENSSIIEFSNSLVLLINDQVKGWIITHRFSPNRIHYSALYIDDQYRKSGLWLTLLGQSLQIHCSKLTDATFGTLEITLSQIPVKWAKFVDKRLSQHAYKIFSKNHYWINL